MRKITKEDTKPQTPEATASDSPVARKRVAKKAATQTTAEPVAELAASKKVVKKTAAKKVVAEEIPAKKVPVKRAVKKSAASSTPELPFDIAPVPRPLAVPTKITAPSAVKSPRPKKAAAQVATGPSTTAENEIQPSGPAPRRFGRVAGGGPTLQRGSESPPAPPQQSTPFPQSTAPQERRETPPHEGQPQNPQPPRDGQPPRHQQDPQRNAQNNAQGGTQPSESRSKRRREKRKRRNQERNEQVSQPVHGQQNPPIRQRFENRSPQGQGRQKHHAQQQDSDERRPALQLDGPKIEGDGMLELAPKGFGFLRLQRKNFEQARDDIFVTPETIRKYNLRLGQWIHGLYQEGPRGPQLAEITKINDLTPEEAAKLPHFDELKAINPNRRISFETTPERFTTRVVDIMAPVGRGQRGLIVSPPRSGKTTLLLHMAQAIREKYDEGAIHLMVVLVDERPEEVTEFRRALPGAEIYASSNDEQARNHTRIAELAIERAKRLVEAGRDVFLIMDSITRLARAYNGNMNNRGRGTGSGGLTIGALEVPRRLFAAARNTRGGGSLTIMATALIQTNSRADEAIYMEFKGTGNMELVLDRKIAENYIYPAVDIFKSGTRREELLLADHMLHKIHLIRRGLSGHRPAEAMERLLFFLKKFPNNPQMLLEIKG